MLKLSLSCQNKDRYQLFLTPILIGVFLVSLVSAAPIKTADDAGTQPIKEVRNPTWWSFQAIDTMKFSRDPSRQFLSNPDKLKKVARQQVTQIAQTGATHVAIATPYDEEFLPVLREWVQEARNNNLKVWFRGNWSGWEGWFGYTRITRQQHLEKTIAFIETYPELFEDGDVFSACPECENGGPGDPRLNGDVQGHRQFLIDEYQATAKTFRGNNRDVQVNYNSMNGDVARLIMDRATTQALGGLVVIDHYVHTPERLNQDVTDYAQRTGGKVILGELGAPIPDIHGQMSEADQATWINDSLELLVANSAVHGVSYWTNVGGSTAIWNEDGTARPAVDVIRSYFAPQAINGEVLNTLGQPLNSGFVQTSSKIVTTHNGRFVLPYVNQQTPVQINAPGYLGHQTTIAALMQESTVRLEPLSPNLWYRFRVWLAQ